MFGINKSGARSDPHPQRPDRADDASLATTISGYRDGSPSTEEIQATRLSTDVGYSEWIWSEEHKRHFCAVYDVMSYKQTNTLDILEYQWEGGRRQSIKLDDHWATRVEPSRGVVTEKTSDSKLQNKLEKRSYRKHKPNLKAKDASEIDEYLGSNYRRIQVWSYDQFFVRGRVFTTLWSDPANLLPYKDNGKELHDDELSIQEIRRFVVIQNKETFSQCIGIRTYWRQGTTKQGVIAANHAIIYSSTFPPALLPGEAGRMTKIAIRVNVIPGQSLETQARVDFSKPYAVEHNVKLIEIGMVAKEHIHLLDAYFKECGGL
ncbi:hypothetical protein BDV96DRAFT_577680 [Lophiotrema nucula]|uniref:DUF6590 domain-containing protein n=1 Tax=Lophiotrema nucula TaxID=690887 RepID=A0A6A5Z718_9PLEO|nr:hypothetical protein BDV96DRAFT_577680 [Lophiotrema nucula]